MAKTFRDWKVDEAWLLPPSVRELVPADDPANFVRDLVRDELDLSAILGTYSEERGYPPYHPAMMTALLLFSYTQGIYSSRRIAKACRSRVDFMAVTAMQQPDFRTVSDFRLRHLGALAELFQQVLRLCAEAGLVKLGHVAVDGTKIKANASKHRAMSYERMKKADKELAAEVASWFERADRADREEDARFGREKTGEEMPDWVANKQKRLEVIRAAKARLEQQAKDQLAAGTKPDDDPDPPRPHRGHKLRPRSDGEPHPKTQLNFTDADSRIMKTSSGFEQSYNCQLAVDAEAQIIVAHQTTNEQSDAPQLLGVVEQIKARVRRNPQEVSADYGYMSEENLRALKRRRIRGYIAAGRQHHGEAPKRTRAPHQGPLAKAMRLKLARGGHRSRYRLRKQTVEPVFGQVKEARSFRRFLLRGLAKVRSEWALLCTAHNLLKLMGS